MSAEIRFYSRRTPYFQFSNFYYAPMTIEGKNYPTTEHYFQAVKYINPIHQEKVRTAKTPGEAKILGRKFPLRPDWEEVKENVMRTALEAKFSQHEDLRDLLLGTGEAILIEWSPSDKYWGAHKNGGSNRLGVLLMELRDILRAAK